MTLTRLVLAWLPVAVVFAVVGRSGAPGGGGARAAGWRALEAAVTTLFASLWFDSLGRGEWWLVFLLVGVLVGFSTRFPEGQTGMSRAALLLGLRDAARYVLAGAILAWRLG